jgi:hypothetical protein
MRARSSELTRHNLRALPREFEVATGGEDLNWPSGIFDYIKGFYNRARRHKHRDQLSPREFERQCQAAL